MSIRIPCRANMRRKCNREGRKGCIEKIHQQRKKLAMDRLKIGHTKDLETQMLL